MEPYRVLAEAGPPAVAEEAYKRGLSSFSTVYVVKEVCGVSLAAALDATAEAAAALFPEREADESG